MGDTEVAAVREAAEQLNIIQRRVLVLHYAEDLTIAEIAMVLNLPQRSVETIVAQLHDMALQHLGGQTSAPSGVQTLSIDARVPAEAHTRPSAV